MSSTIILHHDLFDTCTLREIAECVFREIASTKTTRSSMCELAIIKSGLSNKTHSFANMFTKLTMLPLALAAATDQLRGLNRCPPRRALPCFQSKEELQAAVDDYIENGPDRCAPRIGEWCVSGVTDFSGLFKNKDKFNESIERWDLSNAVTTAYMFEGASSFNQPVEAWNVANVEDM